MAFLKLVNLDEMARNFANLPMFPVFDMAHYIVSVLALREQAGVLQFSRVNPFACWFSAMLYCFGGAMLSGLMLAEPPVDPFSNGINVLISTAVWYLMFYCPLDLVYSCAKLRPCKLVLSILKEVNRTWKILGGIIQAQSRYNEGLIIMIAVGWAKGAGAGLLRNFELLARGVWKPEIKEHLKMAYPTKITLIGAVLFSLQQINWLPLEKHALMLIFTTLNVSIVTKIILTGSSGLPFGSIETKLFDIIFNKLSAPINEDFQPCSDNHSELDKFDELVRKTEKLRIPDRHDDIHDSGLFFRHKKKK